MAIAVPSRFSCLDIEDEAEESPQSVAPKDLNKKAEKKASSKDINLKSEKFNTSKTISNNKQVIGAAKKNKKRNNEQQWEEWKQKDAEIVNGNYEEDLQNAIMLSKLDYEHKKELYQKLEQDNDQKNLQKQSKKKKNKIMTFSEFLNAGAPKINIKLTGKANHNSDSEADLRNANFFKNIEIEAKQVVNKEQMKEKRKKQEVNIDEKISIAQYQEKLDQEKEKNYALQLELDKTKTKITAIKQRNKALCDILRNGEMKHKADLLLELEKTALEKAELTEEVSKLHVLLEQERSKVAVLTSESHNKYKDKKK